MIKPSNRGMLTSRVGGGFDIGAGHVPIILLNCMLSCAPPPCVRRRPLLRGVGPLVVAGVSRCCACRLLCLCVFASLRFPVFCGVGFPLLRPLPPPALLACTQFVACPFAGRAWLSRALGPMAVALLLALRPARWGLGSSCMPSFWNCAVLHCFFFGVFMSGRDSFGHFRGSLGFLAFALLACQVAFVLSRCFPREPLSRVAMCRSFTALLAFGSVVARRVSMRPAIFVCGTWSRLQLGFGTSVFPTDGARSHGAQL